MTKLIIILRNYSNSPKRA